MTKEEVLAEVRNMAHDASSSPYDSSVDLTHNKANRFDVLLQRIDGLIDREEREEGELSVGCRSCQNLRKALGAVNVMLQHMMSELVRLETLVEEQRARIEEGE